MTPPSCLIYTSFVWVFVSVWVSECMFFLKFYLKLKTCGLVSGRKVAVFLKEIGRIKAGPAEEKIKYIQLQQHQHFTRLALEMGIYEGLNKQLFLFYKPYCAFCFVPEVVLFVSYFIPRMN